MTERNDGTPSEQYTDTARGLGTNFSIDLVKRSVAAL